MKSLIASAFLLLSIAVSASAQVAEKCRSVPTQPTVRPETRVGFKFCHSLKDEKGNKTSETIPQQARVVVDGTEWWKGNVAPLGGENSIGLTEFETIKDLLFNAGLHQATISVLTSKGESKVATYNFKVDPSITVPAAPLQPQIVLGSD